MTTVVAVADGTDVWMAADTMTNVYDRPIYTARKIRRITTPSGDVLIGVSGDGALGDMIERRVEYPELVDDDYDRWATEIACAITVQALAETLVTDGRVGGNFILGAVGRLWTLVHMQAIAHDDGMAAIGSGEGPAIGVLQARMFFAEEITSVAAVRFACLVAIARDTYSGGDIIVEHLAAVAPETGLAADLSHFQAPDDQPDGFNRTDSPTGDVPCVACGHRWVDSSGGRVECDLPAGHRERHSSMIDAHTIEVDADGGPANHGGVAS